MVIAVDQDGNSVHGEPLGMIKASMIDRRARPDLISTTPSSLGGRSY
ncbi:MAG: hypothetical protein WCP82_02420 [Alphaproteobacteria bacterium]|jgi:hypothetical protein